MMHPFLAAAAAILVAMVSLPALAGTVELELPDFGNMRLVPNPEGDRVSVEQCKGKRKGFPVISRKDPRKAFCAGPEEWIEWSGLADGTPLVRKECRYSRFSRYSHIGSPSEFELDRPEDGLSEGKAIDSFCQLGVMDPDEVRAARQGSGAGNKSSEPNPPTPSSPAPTPTRESPRQAKLPEPTPPPQQVTPSLPQKTELPKLPEPLKPPELPEALKLPELPKSRLINPMKPPALVAKAQKQPISQACAAVMNSRKISSMCDFVSGVPMFANDVRIPPQYVSECPSPLEYDYVDPGGGKPIIGFATPRKGIVYTCGAPLQQVHVR